MYFIMYRTLEHVWHMYRALNKFGIISKIIKVGHNNILNLTSRYIDIENVLNINSKPYLTYLLVMSNLTLTFRSGSYTVPSHFNSLWHHVGAFIHMTLIKININRKPHVRNVLTISNLSWPIQFDLQGHTQIHHYSLIACTSALE